MQDEWEREEEEEDNMCLSISEVSELTDITPSNLRFFEEEGILNIPRDGAGRRVYYRKEMEELLGLVCLKQAGMDLKEIKRFFQLVRQGDSTAMKTRIRELQKCLKYSKIKMDYIGQCSEAYDRGEPLPQVNPEWMNSFLKRKPDAQGNTIPPR